MTSHGIIDLGGKKTNVTYRELYDEPAWHYIRIYMVPEQNVDLVLEYTYQWGEVKANLVNILTIAAQIFERIKYFWATVVGVWWILKARGRTCIIVPSGGFEHHSPVDRW